LSNHWLKKILTKTINLKTFGRLIEINSSRRVFISHWAYSSIRKTPFFYLFCCSFYLSLSLTFSWIRSFNALLLINSEWTSSSLLTSSTFLTWVSFILLFQNLYSLRSRISAIFFMAWMVCTYMSRLYCTGSFLFF